MNKAMQDKPESLDSEKRSRIRDLLRGPYALTAGALVILLGVAGFLAWKTGVSRSFDADAPLTHTVARGDLAISFTERGSIEASESTQIFCRVEGNTTIVSIVAEGTKVKEGDLLVEFDSSSFTQQINQQEIQVESSYAELVQSQEELKIQKSQNQSNLDLAELTLELAKIDLRKYLEGEWPIELDKAKGEIFLTSQQLENARNDYEWTRRLASKGYVTKTKLKSDELQKSKYEVDKRQAELALVVLQKYTHEKDTKQYDSDVNQAQAALERTLSKNTAYLAKANATLKANESTYNLDLKRLKKLQDQLEKTRILAPQDGMVVYPRGRHWRESRIIEQGASVHENQHLIDLPDISTMAVSVQVHESRIDQVTVGTPAFISVDALPNLNLRGKVSKIGLLPDSVNRWLNPDLKVYRTDITLDDSLDVHLVKPGMSAKVELVVARLRDTLYVPVQSVTTIEGVHHCYLLEDGEFVPRKVETGLFNESFVEIKEGLSEGEEIQLLAPRPQGTANREGEISDDEVPETPTPRERRNGGPEGDRGKGRDRPEVRGQGGPPAGGEKTLSPRVDSKTPGVSPTSPSPERVKKSAGTATEREAKSGNAAETS
jgi:HlyD family secretion protein